MAKEGESIDLIKSFIEQTIEKTDILPAKKDDEGMFGKGGFIQQSNSRRT